ncbi:MAG: PAS domain S-box protein [Spirochaetales bacterium]|nr:PAS domain S-box protein [Spirochaetales bacterium]
MKSLLFRSLIFKIGFIIIIIEIVLLTAAGVYYTRQFNEEVDARVYNRTAHPGKLIAKGMLGYEVVKNREDMIDLAGDDIAEAMIIAASGEIFYSLHTEHEGRDISQLTGFSPEWFSPSVSESFIHRETEKGDNYVISITPIFADKTKTPDYFFYLKVFTNHAAREKQNISNIYLIGTLICVILTFLSILLSFRVIIFRRLAATLDGLRRFENGDLNARIIPVTSHDEITILQHRVNSMAAKLQETVGNLGKEITEREKSEKRITHLNTVLHTIRNINQLIVQERDRDILLPNACKLLIQTRGYYLAQIALFNDNGDLVITAGADKKNNQVTLRELYGDTITEFFKKALSLPKALVLDTLIAPQDTSHHKEKNTEQGNIVIRLVQGDYVYGLLIIGIQDIRKLNEEESSLLEEIANDIAYALYSLEIEEKRRQTEIELQKHHNQLEKLVTERTAALEKINKDLGLEINERKKTEKKVLLLNLEQQTILDSVPTQIWYKDLNNRFLRVNKMGAESVKMKAEDIEGKGAEEIFPEKAAHNYQDDMEVIKSGKPKLGIIETVRSASGELLWVQTDKVPYPDDKGKMIGLIVFVTDITKLKQAEISIKKYAEQLEAANKELQAFSYSVSHDLRAPLRAIMGFSNILLEDCSDKLDSEGLRHLNIIRSEVSRMGVLIDDILSLSRLGRQEMKRMSIDMHDLAMTVFREIKAANTERKLELKMEELPRAKGDKNLLRQVFVNLISNAVKFTKSRETGKIEIGSRQDETGIIYYVRDNGVGFDMKYLNKLFGVFQRLHSVEEFEGTGIGLAIVKRIITRHGGSVRAEGKLNEGAAFYFTLPIGNR